MRLLHWVFAAVAACGIVMKPDAAHAQSDSYRVEANSTRVIDVSICNPMVEIHLNGDDDTDVDYVITDSRGQTVHSEYGLSDEIRATLRRRSGVQCEEFQVRASNLGDVWNLVDVTLSNVTLDNSNPTQTGSYRVDANGEHRVDLNICNPQVRVDIRGDGDTDLDFVIRNSRGEEVHSDYSLTDHTSTTLYRRAGMDCEPFTLVTTNLGDVYNLYQVVIEDVVTGVSQRGSGDERNRAVSIENRTGQTIIYLYWSNTAASGWGEDRLGSGVLASGQDWNVTVDDASGACRFDFKAELADGREVEQRNVDVCAVYTIQFN